MESLTPVILHMQNHAQFLKKQLHANLLPWGKKPHTSIYFKITSEWRKVNPQ